MNPKLVIAVDAIRDSVTGAYSAAAVVYTADRAEPLFTYTDGRGVRRKSYLFRRPEKLTQPYVKAVASYIRNSAVAVAPYTLPASKAPANAEIARQVAMLFAVKRAADRLRVCARTSVVDMSKTDVLLLVSGRHVLNSRQLGAIRQQALSTARDWRLQAARFYAKNAFQPIV